MSKKSSSQSSPVAAAAAQLKRGRGRPKKGEEPALSSLPLPSTPQVSIGLDIGVEGFHVCVPVAGQDVKEWPVWFIRYEGNPHWRKQLAAMLDENTICLAEPTGWNYLSPVARVICLQSSAKLYLIEHARTTHVRRTIDIAQKTDVNDARTLAYAALQIRFMHKFAGCWLFDWATSDALLKLRFLMNAYHKASADRTRFKNRLNHLGHSIDPALTNGSAWLTAMKWGAFTPKQIAALDTSAMPSSTRRAIARLLEYLDYHRGCI
jgi:Transposase.